MEVERSHHHGRRGVQGVNRREIIANCKATTALWFERTKSSSFGARSLHAAVSYRFVSDRRENYEVEHRQASKSNAGTA